MPPTISRRQGRDGRPVALEDGSVQAACPKRWVTGTGLGQDEPGLVNVQATETGTNIHAELFEAGTGSSPRAETCRTASLSNRLLLTALWLSWVKFTTSTSSRRAHMGHLVSAPISTRAGRRQHPTRSRSESKSPELV